MNVKYFECYSKRIIILNSMNYWDPRSLHALTWLVIMQFILCHCMTVLLEYIDPNSQAVIICYGLGCLIRAWKLSVSTPAGS